MAKRRKGEKALEVYPLSNDLKLQAIDKELE